jgi:hypothetical protein
MHKDHFNGWLAVVVDISESDLRTHELYSNITIKCKTKLTYEGRLQSSWTHLITPSRNFVEVRWRSLYRSTSLGKGCTSYNAPPTSRKRATDRWSLRHFLPRSSLFMVWKDQKSHGARSELNSVFGLEKVDRWNPIRTSAVQSRSRPMRFLGFSCHEKGASRQEISKWSTVCSTFSRNGRSVVRSASLANGGTSKKRPSPHLHKVPTRSNKVSPRNFQMALVPLTWGMWAGESTKFSNGTRTSYVRHVSSFVVNDSGKVNFRREGRGYLVYIIYNYIRI